MAASPSSQVQPASVLAYRLALLTAGVTFVLIIIGGLVWSTGSALACPDWPLCHDQFFPKMEGQVLFEHGHRLVALLVSVLSAAMLGVALWNRSLVGLVLAEVGLVLIQAIFGGLTVILRLPLIVRVFHLGFSQLTFAATLLLAVRAFQVSRGEGALANLGPARRQGLAVAAGAVYVQLLLGALVRHTGSGIACTSAFLCDGSAWPAFGPGQIQMVHRYFALVATGLVLYGTVRALPELKQSDHRLPRLLAILSHVLILVQIGLGIGTVQSLLAVPVATAHLACGALLWGDLVLLWACTGAPAQAHESTESFAGLSQAEGRS